MFARMIEAVHLVINVEWLHCRDSNILWLLAIKGRWCGGLGVVIDGVAVYVDGGI